MSVDCKRVLEDVTSTVVGLGPLTNDTTHTGQESEEVQFEVVLFGQIVQVPGSDYLGIDGHPELIRRHPGEHFVLASLVQQ